MFTYGTYFTLSYIMMFSLSITIFLTHGITIEYLHKSRCQPHLPSFVHA